MTYEELIEKLNSMTEEQKKLDVSIYVSDICEFYPVSRIEVTKEDDVLDKDHPFIVAV